MIQLFQWEADQSTQLVANIDGQPDASMLADTSDVHNIMQILLASAAQNGKFQFACLSSGEFLHIKYSEGLT